MNNTIEHYLSIKLDNELFAISVHKVLEVLEKQEITKVPNTPELIKGVINFRGEILPVVEARYKFNMPEREPDAKYVIIVLELTSDENKIMLGVIADSVKDVLEINDQELKDVPDMGVSFNHDYLKGMLKLNSGFLMLLDVDKVFSTYELTLLEEANN